MDRLHIVHEELTVAYNNLFKTAIALSISNELNSELKLAVELVAIRKLQLERAMIDSRQMDLPLNLCVQQDNLMRIARRSLVPESENFIKDVE